MASIDNHILTITEPTIKLDQVKFASLGEGEGNEKANTSKGYILMVSINGYTFSDWEILSMELDCTGTIPTIDISIIDTEGVFGVDSFPRDGDVINFRMGTLEKDQYKDIRIDFDISSADAPPQRGEGRGNKYHFSGRIKVPGLYAEDCKAYGVGTSLDHIESIANDLKLGVATNIDSADDSMNLVIPYNSMFDTLEDLVRHSYIDEDSFQTFCIDPYYYVNYVNLNKLMDSEENIEEMIAAFEKELADTPQAPAEGVNKTKRPLVLTNHKRDQGSNLFIVKQALKNKAGAAAKKNGYKRVLQYFENDSDEGLVSHDIEPLASKNMKDIEEPMRGRRDEDRYKNEIKYKYVGRKCGDPETSNTHLNYEYSAISNAQNMAEVTKMSLDVELATFNPALHRYHKIPVVIYTGERQRLDAENQVKEKKEKDGFDSKPTDQENGGLNQGEMIVDEFLSGYYVIGGFKYLYKAGATSVKQELNLLRREWPSRVNNINAETVTPEPTPNPAPAPEPTPPAAPIDAVMGEWGEWGPCENGQQKRKREVKEPAQNGGVTGELEETQECTASKYTYKSLTFGPKKLIVMYKEGNEIYRGEPSFASTFEELKEQAFVALETEHPDIKGATLDSKPEYTYRLDDLGFEKQFVVSKMGSVIYTGKPSMTATLQVLRQEAANELKPSHPDIWFWKEE